MRPETLRAPRTPKSRSFQPDHVVADAIATALKRHGVKSVFGQSIPSALLLACADVGIRQVVYRTEHAGAAMADGFARVGGRIGVVMGQNGPAATLLVPGLAEAAKSSIPVLCIIQDVPRPTVDRNAFQELDHLALFAACVKWVRRVERGPRVVDMVDQAIVAATTGRPGPAVLIVPMDLLVEPIAPAAHRGAVLGRYPLDPVVPPKDAIRAAAGMVAEARAPVVIAGGGVHLSGAHEALARLQELAGLPVGTTVMGKGGVDETHPLSIGVIGNVMGLRSYSRHARSLISDADLVILVATRTAQNGTDSWELLPEGASFIHVDVDGLEVGRNYEAVRLVGDARLTLEALNEELAGRDLSKRRGARPAVEMVVAEARRLYEENTREVLTSGHMPIRPERIMAEVDRILTPDTIVVGDASYSSLWVANYLRARRPGMRFLTPRGLAGLGWGLPLALGAKCASSDQTVLCFSGDGGFAHVWSELETAVREQLNVVLTIFNNQVLGYQKDAEDERHGRHTDACYLSPVDHGAVARAAGCAGVRIENPDAYGPALAEALRRNGPTLIDVVTDPDAYPPLTPFDHTIEAVRAARDG